MTISTKLAATLAVFLTFHYTPPKQVVISGQATISGTVSMGAFMFYDDNFSSGSCTSQLSFSGTGTAAVSTDVHVTGSPYSCMLTSGTLSPPTFVNFGPELGYVFPSGANRDPQFHGLWKHTKMAVAQSYLDAVWNNCDGTHLCGAKLLTEHRPNAGGGPTTGYGWGIEQFGAEWSGTLGAPQSIDDGSTNGGLFLCPNNSFNLCLAPNNFPDANYVSPALTTVDLDEWLCHGVNANDCFTGSTAGVSYYQQCWNGIKRIDVNDGGSSDKLGPIDFTHAYVGKHGIITIETGGMTSVTTIKVYYLQLQAGTFNFRASPCHG